MEAIKAKQPQKLTNECSATNVAATAPLSLPLSPAARRKAGLNFPVLCQLTANFYALLLLLAALSALRKFLLETPLTGSALQKVKQIRERKELLTQIDALIWLLLRLFFAATPKIKRKKLREQKKVAKFWSLVTEIAKKGKMRLQPIERWIEQLIERLSELSNLYHLAKLANQLNACETQSLLSRSPPEREKPFDITLCIASPFVSPCAPRMRRAPTSALPAGAVR